MAGYPPPYPPPSGQPPYGYDARQQRQMLKEQARAYKNMQRVVLMQAKQRRDFERQQFRAARRSSILGPLVVVAIGVILLLIGTGKLPLSTFAGWYARWWPLFLVSAGVILLAEWAIDQRPRPEGVPYVRRGIGGGAIFLLILLAIVGPIMNGTIGGHDFLTHGFSINPDNIDEIFGERHDSQQEIDQAFAAGTSLSVDDPRGDVTIVGKSGDDHIHITVNKQMYVAGSGNAEDRARQLSPRVELVGSTLSVTMPYVSGGTSDLSITVPDQGQTTVTTNHGTVNVSSMKAAVNLTSNHGDIDVSSVTGAVNAHINSSGSSFSGHNITGPLSVKGHAQDLSISDVTGDVSLEGEFYGDTHLERLQGQVSFHTTRTQLTLARLDGEVDLSPHSELTGSQMVGPVRLHTSSRNITLERVAGDVDVVNSKGSVDLTSATLGNITVENRDGGVNLTVPEHAGFSIDAATRDGSVENDLSLTSTTSNERTTLEGKVGDGGSKVTLHTTHADIDVHRGMVAPPVPPAPPASPAVTAAPAGTAAAKHEPAGKVQRKAKPEAPKAPAPPEEDL